ncbi:MAG: uncharacterized protein JWO62_176 [Acidimicrobiaceae bacterium]|nr:uncharacterized protein [Acidimicrobiaceae bacterium]
MTDLVSNETIAEIAQSFWGAFLPDDGELVHSFPLAVTEDIRGRVDVEGAWRGSVELSCSLAVARRVASVMFAVPDSALTASDIDDAMGELVNVVGGSIKSILPPPTSLSLPMVDDDSEWRFGVALESEVSLSWAGEPVTVRVWKAERPGA